MKSFKTYLAEQELNNKVDEFARYACGELGIESVPQINLVDSKQEAIEARSFGGYYPADHAIKINTAGRHVVDIMRTLAHELVHHKQNLDGRLEDVAMAGETGSTHENEANSMAGVLMRNFGRSNPQIYEEKQTLV